MFSLENYRNLKRRRNKAHAEQGEFPSVANPLTLTALEETCNATATCSAIRKTTTTTTRGTTTTIATMPSIALETDKEVIEEEVEVKFHRQHCGHQHKSHLIASESKKSINNHFLPSSSSSPPSQRISDDVLQSRRKNSKTITAVAAATASASSFSTWTSLCLSSIISSAWTSTTSLASPQPATVSSSVALIKAIAAMVARFVRTLSIATSNSNTTTATTTNISRRHMLLTLMLLLFVCFVNTSSAKAADTLSGNLQSCSDENEEIHLAIKNSKCYTCSCQNSIRLLGNIPSDYGTFDGEIIGNAI